MTKSIPILTLVSFEGETPETPEIPEGFTGIAQRSNGVSTNGMDIIHCKDGEIHREDGPAIEIGDGGGEWYFEGKLRRMDGPAIETWYGLRQHWILGLNFSVSMFNRTVQEINQLRGENPELTIQEALDILKPFERTTPFEQWKTGTLGC